MPSVRERASRRLSDLRERRPLVDHAVRAFAHYGGRDGNSQAGAVTFYAFLSFFPLLALAFFVVGVLSQVYPELRDDLAQLIEDLLPGVVGNGADEIPMGELERLAAAAGWLGLAGVLYAGLGWVSAMRRALGVMFVKPAEERPAWIVGKARDLAALPVLGAVLLLSVTFSGAVAWSSQRILDALGAEGTWVSRTFLWAVGHGLGIAATTLLLLAMFRLLARPQVAGRGLRQGALLGAVGFEVLKSLAGYLVELTRGQVAFQVFGVALILLVWINYFSRLVMLSASWGYTAPVSEEVRVLAREPLVDGAEAELLVPAPAAVVGEQGSTVPGPPARRRTAVAASAALGAVAVGVLTWLRRGKRR